MQRPTAESMTLQVAKTIFTLPHQIATYIIDWEEARLGFSTNLVQAIAAHGS
jgi:hypothetical protein